MLYGSLNQKAVYWGTPVTDGYGKLTFANPVEIDVRWEDKMELFLSFNGKEDLSQSIIYSETDMVSDGYLYLGELTDLSAEEKVNPLLEIKAYPIKQFKKSPDITGQTYIRKTWL